MKRRNLALAGLAIAMGLRVVSANSASCEQLSSLKLPHTEITLAQSVATGAFKPPAGSGASGPPVPPGAYSRLPAFCRVAGTIRPTADSDIRFEVWMPAEGWNGKFVGVGNGVWAGSITHFGMVEPLAKGYASAATDDGHQGNALDASFAAGHPEKLVDFGHRAVHEMTVAAKAVIAGFYGRKTHRSLFVSCSTGGRQGLMEAWRYPRDYDGISSMAPANPMTALMVSSLWTGYAALKDDASRIPPPKFAALHKAAVAACDKDDGVADSVISSPHRCRFDPASMQCKGEDANDCLTEKQVAAVRAIYEGPRTTRGEQIHPGFTPGSEMQWSLQTMGPEPFGAATTYMRSLVFRDPKWDFKSFDYDRDFSRAIATGSKQLDVPPKGFDRFFRDGRKLLLTHGWADGLIPAAATVGFYRELTRKPTENARLFMIPGMAHCAGGSGPWMFDAIATIDAWVETGRAPERIVVSNPPNAPARTRPLCPWPQEAVYSGQGSTDDEKNFSCKA
jgi:feruloyl esterase